MLIHYTFILSHVEFPAKIRGEIPRMNTHRHLDRGEQPMANLRPLDQEDGASWMGRLGGVIGGRRITEVSLPGSHNSATCEMRGDIANDEGGKQIAGMIPNKCGGWVIGPIVRGWCKTQPLSIRQQLEAGVRYLDLRVGYDASQPSLDLALRTCHGFFSSPAIDILTDVAAFLRAHPTELVLLDWNHYYGMDEASHIFLLDAIEKHLSSVLVPREEWLSPIAQLVAADKRVFVFYHHRGSEAASKRRWTLPGSWCQSPWPNVSQWEGLEGRLEGILQERLRGGTHASGGSGPETVHVVQGILTEGRGEIIRGVVSMIASACCLCIPCLTRRMPCYAPSSVMQLAKDVNPKVVSLLQRKSREGGCVNVALLDWITGWQDVAWILQMNVDRKGTLEV